MASRRKIFDAVVLHRIDVQRFGKGEALAHLRMLGLEDRAFIEDLRRRFPNLKAGDIRGARAKLLAKSMREMRAASIAKVRDSLRDRLIQFGVGEGGAISKVVAGAVGAPVSFAPIRSLTIREAVTKSPFTGGKNATHTLGQWFEGMRRRDQTRLTGAIQLGIVRNETIDDMVRRIAGTKAAGFKDGVLSITRREAEVAVRTAVNHTANAAQMAWGEANKDVVIGMEWTALLDERTCPICADLDGGFVPTDDADPPRGMTELDVTPPAHPQCRCTLVPVFDLDRLADKVDDEGI